MGQLHSRVVVGEDVVVAVLGAVGRQLCHRAWLLRGHLNGAKLLQEELVVVGAHHQQLVHKAIDGDGRVGLQSLSPVVGTVLLHRVSELVATTTRDPDRAGTLKAVGWSVQFVARTVGRRQAVGHGTPTM